MGRFGRLNCKLVTVYSDSGRLGCAVLGLVGHPFKEPGVGVISDGNFERDEEASLGEGGEEGGAASENCEANADALSNDKFSLFT
jgi:hypothetical protein